MKKKVFAAVAIFWAGFAWAAEPPLESLLAELSAQDPQARSHARENLPKHGVDAVQPLFPLLLHPDGDVAAAAFDILLQIGKTAVDSGCEFEAGEVAARLMPLVSGENPPELRMIGLRLLEGVVPAGTDIAPVAAMLQEAPPLQDRARVALQRMDTPESRAALRNALSGAEPAFQVALLNTLGEMQDSESVEAVKRLTASRDADVRNAAAQALAWRGDPTDIAIVNKVISAAGPETRVGAIDAMLQLLEAVVCKGGDWEAAVETYKSLLAMTEGFQKGAVLTGLGRVGDAACVPVIIKAIKYDESGVQLAGLAALRELKGADVAPALADAYPALSRDLQVPMLGVLGARKHPAALPILLQAAEAEEADLRLAAIRALGDIGLIESLEALTSAARMGSDDEKTAARDGLFRLAEALRGRKDVSNAGRAYAAIYEVAGDDKGRAAALQGLAAAPVPEGFDAAMAAAAIPALRESATAALMAVAGKLLAAGDKNRARAAYEKVLQLGPPVEIIKLAAKGVQDAGGKVNLASVLGYITSWWLIGPFELGDGNRGWNMDYIREAVARPSGTFKSGYRELAWKHFVSKDFGGKVNLREALADRDACIGYAYAEVTVKADTEAVLLLGVDDSEKVWVNGRKVFELFAARGLTPDQDKIPIKLKAGRNTILLKVWQNMMAWEFCARLAGADGRPIPFTQRME